MYKIQDYRNLFSWSCEIIITIVVNEVLYNEDHLPPVWKDIFRNAVCNWSFCVFKCWIVACGIDKYNTKNGTTKNLNINSNVTNLKNLIWLNNKSCRFLFRTKMNNYTEVLMIQSLGILTQVNYIAGPSLKTVDNPVEFGV